MGQRWAKRRRVAWCCAVLLVCVAQRGAWAIEDASYERAPVRYSASTPDNALSRYFARVARREVELAAEGERGYLDALLKGLQIPVESQVLVFSKTSLQRQKIDPSRPRAVYFNDETYVGYVQQGDVLELSTADPQLGGVFYTLEQPFARARKKDGAGPLPTAPEAALPQAVRQTHNCLQCHDSSSMTLGVPGHMVRSVHADDEGMPRFQLGTFRTNYTSPFAERWGGWYVTGTHGALRHRGNVVFPEKPDFTLLGELGANRTDLASLFDTRRYPSPHSDIVALLVLEHQVLVHNLIARANFETRLALLQCKEINALLNKPPGELTEGTRSRIRSNCEPLVEALLFCEEAPLGAEVKGTSGFREHFEARGPFDAAGRSLRQFDLQKRMFKYPCSYLIYSEAFRALPAEAQAYVFERLWTVLNATAAERPAPYKHLSAADAQAVLEILSATLPARPPQWK